MSRLPEQHLTELELDEALIGGIADLPEDAQLHLGLCEHCQAQFAAIAEPISRFNEVSLAWSERRASTMPLRPPVEEIAAAAQPLWERLLTPGPLACGATAAVAIAAGLAVLPHRHTNAYASVADRPVHALPAASEFSPARADRIARDNQMLHDIDRVLEASEDTPAAELNLRTSPVAHAAASVGAKLAD